MTIYFGFAIADGMFSDHAIICREGLSSEKAIAMISNGVTPCVNKFHTATIDAMQSRFGINVSIPDTPPRVTLDGGDSIIVMSVRGLPRLTESRHYTPQEIEKATFAFSSYRVSITGKPALNCNGQCGI